MDQICRYLVLIVIFLSPSFNCEEAMINTIEVISTGGTQVEEAPEVYVTPLSLDVEPRS